MRFYTKEHLFYCGVYLHARSMYVCVLDQHGKIILHRNLHSNPDAFVDAIHAYREDIVVCAECMFAWHWLAGLCHRESIPFVLGHALYMKAIHGGKAKNDRIDSRKIAGLLRGGMIPQAYVYPREMRATRDLLCRRHYLMRRADLGLIDHYDHLLKRLELHILKSAGYHDPNALHLRGCSPLYQRPSPDGTQTSQAANKDDISMIKNTTLIVTWAIIDTYILRVRRTATARGMNPMTI